MKHVILFVLLAILMPAWLQAQDNEGIMFGQKQSIQSQILGEQRELLVYSPSNTSQRLPLILVLDGDGIFDATVAAVRFMNYTSEMPQMPEAIVIGIQNTDRNRDMPIPQQYGIQKGEDHFFQFVSDELIPWANKKFQLNGHIISIGHSQGGYFVSYMLAKSVEKFPWIIALDAPMNVSANSTPLKETIAKAINDNIKTRYASINAAYGWDEDWSRYLDHNDRTMTKKFSDESHESMVFTGIYAGLKFLFSDFTPPRKEMSLSELKNYYQAVSAKYGYPYEIPLRVLMASASRKIPENKKIEIMDILDYATSKYGLDERIRGLRNKADNLAATGNTIIDSFFALRAPSPAEIKNYLGKWSGQFISKDGTAFPCEIEVSLENGKAKLLTAPDPHQPDNKTEPDLLHVDENGWLIFGKRNRGGGIIVVTLKMDGKNKIAGEGMWLGFSIPADASEDARKQLTFLLTTPTKYILTRK